MTAGAPKKPFKGWKGWENDIISLYSEGASDVEIRGLIADKHHNTKASFDLWDRWLTEEPEFSETIKRGRELSHAWWEKQGRTNLRDKDFSPTLWYMNMKNRHRWADNHQLTGDGGGALVVKITQDDENI